MDKVIWKTRLKMGASAYYQILVQGCLDQKWSGRLAGLEIADVTVEGSSVVTQLSGELIDQAALMGVLNTLYSYQFPLLSVISLDSVDE